MVTIAITGAHGTGKTTLARELAVALEREGLNVLVGPEVPREIASEAADAAMFRRSNSTLARQLLILYRQLEQDLRLADPSRVLICDRTMADHWAYTKVLFPNFDDLAVVTLWEDAVVRRLGYYDAIFYVPTELDPVDDGTRENAKAFQTDVDTELAEIYARAARPVIRLSGPLSVRLRDALSAVSPLIEGTRELVRVAERS